MTLKHRRAIGDTESPMAVQLTRSGQPADLNGRPVKFYMVSETGAVVVPETDVGVSVTDPDLGYVDFDFAAVDVDEEGTYYGFFRVYNAAATEFDTYPEDENGIEIELFDPTTREPVDPTTLTNEELLNTARSPRRVRTVEGTVEERSISDLIKADQYLASKNASGAVPWGIRIAKAKPPSTLS